MSRSTRGLDESLYAYLLAHQPPEHPLLKELRAFTDTLPRGRMQVAPEQGPLLAFLLRLLDARLVLELGTFTGYSALAMALALPADGHIVTCDISEEWTAIARRFWDRAGVAGKIEPRLGPAIDTLRSLEADGLAGSFDFIFLDANKEDNNAYYESALRLVRAGGVIAVDNAFRGGRVADPSEGAPGVAEVRALNAKIAADERVDRVLIPIADGMILVRSRRARS